MIAAAVAVAAAIAVRVVSLAPALTEDLFAIGAGKAVVGVDAFSDRPARALRLPRVGSMRTVNSETIAALNPDLIVGIPYQAPNLRDLERLGVRTQTLPVDTLSEDFDAIATLGRLTGHVADANRLLATLRARLDAAARATARLPMPRAFVVIGVAPIYTAGRGSYIDDLLAIAHVHNVAGTVHAAAFPQLSAETLEAADPDVLVVPSGTIIPDAPPWSHLYAVRAHRIVTIAEDDLLRPGPRVADVVAALVRGIAPYRARAGATAKANTAPSASRRTAMGMP
jgi:iron complex transport system substrate-binding protein